MHTPVALEVKPSGFRFKPIERGNGWQGVTAAREGEHSAVALVVATGSCASEKQVELTNMTASDSPTGKEMCGRATNVWDETDNPPQEEEEVVEVLMVVVVVVEEGPVVNDNSLNCSARNFQVPTIRWQMEHVNTTGEEGRLDDVVDCSIAIWSVATDQPNSASNHCF
jgi:hypothetical protein